MNTTAAQPLSAERVDEAFAAERPNWWALLPARDWAALDAELDALALVPGLKGEQDLVEAANNLAEVCRLRQLNQPKLLDDWQAARPDSFWAPLLRVVHWCGVGWDYRGEGWAGSVGEQQWQAAAYANHAGCVLAMDYLSRQAADDSRLWLLMRSIVNMVGGFEEPQWLTDWLDSGQRPASAVFELDESPELRQLLASRGLDRLELPPLPAQMPACLQPFLPLRAERHEHAQDEAWFWMRVAHGLKRPAVEAIASYANFILPRWGGSWDEILALADAPYLSDLSEEEKGFIRYYAWSDELDPVNAEGDDEDPRYLKQVIAKAEAVLKRPLADNLRGRIHRSLAKLCQQAGRPAEEVAAHYRVTAPLNWVEGDDVRMALTFWLEHDRQGTWLAQMASLNKLRQPQAAVLYGFLCENGWAGLPQNLSVARQWYDHARRLLPPEPYPCDCPFEPVISPLEDAGEQDRVLGLMREAADHGYSLQQLKLGAYYQDAGSHFDLEKSQHYSRLAADNNCGAAISNMAVLTHDQAELPDLPEAQERAWRHQSFEWMLRYLDRMAEEEELSDMEARYVDGFLNRLANGLVNQPADPVVVQRVLPCVREYGDRGHVWCMCAVSRFYVDDSHPLYDYAEAVRWCEGVRRVDPEDEFVQGTIEMVEGTSLIKKGRYALAARRFKAADLPGQGEGADIY
ncbi:MAG: DUF4034 domain-containing protein [Pseudomonadota bacterium]|nr:DUF4034 domain-containing protein [Pseudomonadota bacterium]